MCSIFVSMSETFCFYGRNKVFHRQKQIVSLIETKWKQNFGGGKKDTQNGAKSIKKGKKVYSQSSIHAHYTRCNLFIFCALQRKVYRCIVKCEILTEFQKSVLCRIRVSVKGEKGDTSGIAITSSILN